MVVALWIFAIVACCALCVWGIATAVRRSRERRSGTEALSENPCRGEHVKDVMLTFRLGVGLFLFLATLMWLPPALHLG